MAAVPGANKMKTTFRRYDAQRDFLRVRDLLADTFIHHPLNWTIERWNYARHFVAPLFGSVRTWEENIGIWEDAASGIVGVAHGESDSPDGAHFEIAPEFSSLYPEMIEYAQEHLSAHQNGERRLCLHIQEGNAPLVRAAEQMGYARQPQGRCCITEHAMKNMPAINLPASFTIRSMAECNDIERRRRGLGLSFNHVDPKEWPSAQAYDELQKAPDYRPDLDLYVVAPDGEFIASCIVWHDRWNQVCMLEPVGTHPDYRRRGFAREVIYEGLRRAARLGATRAFVGADFPVYLSIGFRVKYQSYWWERTFN